MSNEILILSVWLIPAVVGAIAGTVSAKLKYNCKPKLLALPGSHPEGMPEPGYVNRSLLEQVKS